MLTVRFADNSTQVVKVSDSFYEPTKVNRNLIMSVQEKAESLAFSFRKKVVDATLIKGNKIVWERTYSVQPNVTEVFVKPDRSEVKHLRRMFKGIKPLLLKKI